MFYTFTLYISPCRASVGVILAINVYHYSAAWLLRILIAAKFNGGSLHFYGYVN